MKNMILTSLFCICFIGTVWAKAPERIEYKENSNLSPALTIAASAILPGSGQWLQERKLMSFVYLALEAAFISGNLYCSQTGNSKIDEYESYADQHWSEELWLQTYNPEIDPTTHTSIVYVDNVPYYPHVVDSYHNMMADMDNGYTTLNIEREYHFYENIGKYAQFKAGWDDWLPGGEDPGDPMNGDYGQYSDNQYLYSSMRRDANKYLHMAGYFASAVVFNHVISALDAGLNIKLHNKNDHLSVFALPSVDINNYPGIFAGVTINF